jgi:hypothetical protein
MCSPEEDGDDDGAPKDFLADRSDAGILSAGSSALAPQGGSVVSG